MESVIPVITHPISLCAYTLFLAFGLVAIKKGHRFFYLAVFLSVVSLVGGLFLAHQQISNVPAPTPTVKSKSTAQPSEQQKKTPFANSTTTQSSAGNQSPNISGAGGDVHLNYGNAGAAPAEQKK